MTPEEQLKEYSRRGDADKLDSLFTKLYHEYSGLVGFVVSRYISSEDIIRSIINESFLKLFENRDEVTNIKYYLVTIAKNQAINEAKWQKKILPFDETMDKGYEPQTYSSIEYQLTIKRLREIIEEEDLKIILSHLVEDRTFAEIAKEMNSKENTIKTRYSRALKKIRKEGM